MQALGRNVKQDILDAGVRLLYTQGIASLTQPRIAREAGVRQSHLTYYFPTRNVMILAIAEHSIEKLLSETEPTDDPRSAADQMADQMLNSPQMRVVQGLQMAADADPELRESLNGFIVRMRERMAWVLSQQQLPHTPMHTLIFHAVLIGLGTMNLARKTETSATELRSGLAALLGLFADMQAENIEFRQ